MSNGKEERNRILAMRREQHRAALLVWISEMPSPWRVFAVMRWRRRMPQFRRGETEQAPANPPMDLKMADNSSDPCATCICGPYCPKEFRDTCKTRRAAKNKTGR